MKLHPEMILPQRGVYGFNLNGAWLAGMAFPSNDKGFWQELSQAGIQRVLCLTHHIPPYTPAPLELLGARALEDLDGEMVPSNPAKEEEQIRSLVEQVCQSINQGKSVVFHCKGGTGRTGTIIAGTLRCLGFAWDEVLEAMVQVNKIRGKYPKGWPDARWQRELVHNWDA